MLVANGDQTGSTRFAEASTTTEMLVAQETMKLRNDLDLLEQKVEPLRGQLGEPLFQSFGTVDVGAAQNFLENLSTVARSSASPYFNDALPDATFCHVLIAVNNGSNDRTWTRFLTRAAVT